jgi:hypothetical protein
MADADVRPRRSSASTRGRSRAGCSGLGPEVERLVQTSPRIRRPRCRPRSSSLIAGASMHHSPGCPRRDRSAGGAAEPFRLVLDPAATEISFARRDAPHRARSLRAASGEMGFDPETGAAS